MTFENEVNTFFRNVEKYSPNDATSHAIGQESSTTYHFTHMFNVYSNIFETNCVQLATFGMLNLQFRGLVSHSCVDEDVSHKYTIFINTLIQYKYN